MLPYLTLAYLREEEGEATVLGQKCSHDEDESSNSAKGGLF